LLAYRPRHYAAVWEPAILNRLVPTLLAIATEQTPKAPTDSLTDRMVPPNGTLKHRRRNPLAGAHQDEGMTLGRGAAQPKGLVGGGSSGGMGDIGHCGDGLA